MCFCRIPILTMEERRELFDASAYMLFEATGDSESLYSDAAESDAAEDDGGDAQSCSYRSSCRTAARADGDVIHGVDFDYRSGDEEEEDGGEGSDDEDGVVDQCRIRRLKAAEAEPAKSKGCDESNAMMMNEREGDKLFWEACLAS